MWNTSPDYMVGRAIADSRGSGSQPIKVVPDIAAVPSHLEKVTSPWSVAVDYLSPRGQPCKNAASPANPEHPRCALSSEHPQSSSVGGLGILRGLPYLNIPFPISERDSRLLFMSFVGVAHTSCAHGTSGFLPSRRPELPT